MHMYFPLSRSQAFPCKRNATSLAIFIAGHGEFVGKAWERGPRAILYMYIYIHVPSCVGETNVLLVVYVSYMYLSVSIYMYDNYIILKAQPLYTS